MNLYSYIKILMIATAVLFLTGTPAQAAWITFNLDIEFSEGVEPAGSPPWLIARFEDMGSGTVRLTMDASGLTAEEYVEKNGWYFNFDPNEYVDDLSFAFISGKEAMAVEAGTDALKADGDGYYDIGFTWDKKEGALTAGQEAVYDITSSSITLQASMFNFNSTPGGEQGVYRSAALVQGMDDPDIIGNDTDGGGWIGAVPIPGAMLLFGSGLICLLGVRTRSRR